MSRKRVLRPCLQYTQPKKEQKNEQNFSPTSVSWKEVAESGLQWGVVSWSWGKHSSSQTGSWRAEGKELLQHMYWDSLEETSWDRCWWACTRNLSPSDSRKAHARQQRSLPGRRGPKGTKGGWPDFTEFIPEIIEAKSIWINQTRFSMIRWNTILEVKLNMWSEISH